MTVHSRRRFSFAVALALVLSAADLLLRAELQQPVSTWGSMGAGYVTSSIVKPIDPDGSSRRARIIEGVRPQMALQNTVKQQAQASIRTDKFDYQPGETALITGAGYFSR